MTSADPTALVVDTNVLLAATDRSSLELIDRSLGAGRQMHDANVVAVALAHKAAAIVTDNAAHFTRFAGLIAVETVAGD
ncbi:MAG: hypothetical protein FWD74_05200 [Actinomycetia bacterium]|nr:hypothetical protein [Actinomycetes bacterium]